MDPVSQTTIAVDFEGDLSSLKLQIRQMESALEKLKNKHDLLFEQKDPVVRTKPEIWSPSEILGKSLIDFNMPPLKTRSQALSEFLQEVSLQYKKVPEQVTKRNRATYAEMDKALKRIEINAIEGDLIELEFSEDEYDRRYYIFGRDNQLYVTPTLGENGYCLPEEALPLLQKLDVELRSEVVKLWYFNSIEIKGDIYFFPKSHEDKKIFRLAEFAN